MLKLTFVVCSTFSCLISETICVCFSAGGAAVAEVAAFPVVLLSDAGDLVSAVGFFTSFEVGVEVVESDALDLLSAFSSPVVLLSEVDLVSAVGFFMSFEVVVGVVESDAFDLLSAFIPPVGFASGLPCVWGGASFAAVRGVAVSAPFAAGAFIGAAVSPFGEAAAGDSEPFAPP